MGVHRHSGKVFGAVEDELTYVEDKPEPARRGNHFEQELWSGLYLRLCLIKAYGASHLGNAETFVMTPSPYD